jgi:hypothetical protein
MMHARSAYAQCEDLFAAYPLAVQCVDWAGDLHAMVLMVCDGDRADFYMLSRDRSEDKPFYSLVPWRPEGPRVDIDAGRGAVPWATATVLSRAIPLPRHGSLFGWLQEGRVTALLAVYTEYAPEYPEPSWTVMPLADAPAERWPPFTGQHFGSWFWEHYRAGTLVSLAALVAANPGTVFWTGIQGTPGWDCCVVSRDVKSDTGYVLARGCFLNYEALQQGVKVPPPGRWPAGVPQTDLTPLLRPLADASRCYSPPAGQGLYSLPA